MSGYSPESFHSVIQIQVVMWLTLLLKEVWHSQTGKVRDEWARVIGSTHGINSGCGKGEGNFPGTGIELVLAQRVQEGERILAPREADHYTITIMDHVKFSKSLEEWKELLRGC